MLAEVRRTIRREAMLKSGEPVWVAVSGGVDSMVLLHVLHCLGHPVQVAHVDHGLRGAESDADRAFVEAQAGKLGLPFRAVRVDVKSVADGSSVQMAARQLRYQWFKALLREGPPVIALGHHADDRAETLLLHLLRGIGARGWNGMPAVTRLEEGRVCRPLLGVGRKEIAAYAAAHGIAFREDASNRDPKYLRNRVRNELVPFLEDLRPGARNALAHSAEALHGLARTASRQLEHEARTIRPGTDGSLSVPLKTLKRSAAPQLLLLHLLRPDSPHPDLVARILEAVESGATGSRFQVGRRWATLDREALVVDHGPVGFPTFTIFREHLPQGSAGPFKWATVLASNVDLGEGMNTAWLDLATLDFPLVLRPWRHGERMRPIGLRGSKLISDILTDGHADSSTKPGTYVLASGERIIWLVGHRVAEGHSPAANTKEVLRIDYRPL